MILSKRKLHQELLSCYREYFESKLAISLLNHPELLLIVGKVSKNILLLIKNNEKEVLKRIAEDPKIITELYDAQYFGRLYTKDLKVMHPAAALVNIYQTLANKQVDLTQHMQIHAVFMQRLYDHLIIKDPEKDANDVDKNKRELVQIIFSNDLFNEKNRGRLPLMNIPLMSKQLGIVRNKVFKKMIGAGQLTHLRACDKFVADSSSLFFNKIARWNIPFVAGASGHTGSLLLGACLYGNLTLEELKEYTLACFAFLTSGGNHSFHEVMIVAHKIGIPYKINNYDLCLPRSFKNTKIYHELSSRFPEFLSEKKAIKFFTWPRNVYEGFEKGFFMGAIVGSLLKILNRNNNSLFFVGMFTSIMVGSLLGFTKKNIQNPIEKSLNFSR